MAVPVGAAVQAEAPRRSFRSSFVAATPRLPRVRSKMYRDRVKRGVDLFLILLMAPFAVPLIGLLAAWVARDGGKPFYSQERIGRGGQVYRIWKLRTMVPDADRHLEACLRADPQMRAEWNRKQKLLNDPRITRTGRLLRKTSLDELPQLWNVFLGEMSLVGPRPMMVFQEVMYPGSDYYDLRPGITGLWQISERNASSFSDRAKFDTVYNRTLSLAVDIGILLATVRVVMRGTGH
ncbi:sugar transferase [Jannaschia sp. W003]|uniref:sugar transferase n=1 Tax=Jannaschia sp. W003 TaxID=2867012 RepID=UPI0021A6BA45|nr:sugar transferase [Jannaschia sp. W003]UWQ23211.1 sugar transferase [Jannaschia sp. W003]